MGTIKYVSLCLSILRPQNTGAEVIVESKERLLPCLWLLRHCQPTLLLTARGGARPRTAIS